MEVTPGFEPGNEGFADPCLTTWLCHRVSENHYTIPACRLSRAKCRTSGILLLCAGQIGVSAQRGQKWKFCVLPVLRGRMGYGKIDIYTNKEARSMISMAMLHDAQRVLKPVINRTPVIPTKGLVPGCDFYLKADCLQKPARSSSGARTTRSLPSPTRRRRGASSPAPPGTTPRAWPTLPGTWASRPPSASRRRAHLQDRGHPQLRRQRGAGARRVRRRLR